MYTVDEDILKAGFLKFVFINHSTLNSILPRNSVDKQISFLLSFNIFHQKETDRASFLLWDPLYLEISECVFHLFLFGFAVGLVTVVLVALVIVASVFAFLGWFTDDVLNRETFLQPTINKHVNLLYILTDSLLLF